MRPRTLTLLLTLGLVASLVPLAMAWRLPGDNTGYEPEQPVAYSHRLHAGEMEIPCLYCHSGAERSRYAGIPAMSVCMNCHRLVTAGKAEVDKEVLLAEEEDRPVKRIVSPELAKLYEGTTGAYAWSCGEADCLGPRAYTAGLRTVRSQPACDGRPGLSDVPRSNRDHGAGAPGGVAQHGLVRELPS